MKKSPKVSPSVNKKNPKITTGTAYDRLVSASRPSQKTTVSKGHDKKRKLESILPRDSQNATRYQRCSMAREI